MGIDVRSQAGNIKVYLMTTKIGQHRKIFC